MIRHKSYVILNVIGLSIGLMCSILIGLFVLHELSYDKFNEKREHIYRVYLNGKIGESETIGAWTCPPLGPSLYENFPEVIDYVRLNNWGETTIRYGEKTFLEDHFGEADSSFFRIFSIPLLKGDPGKVLASRYNLVLGERTAAKIFGNEEPVGKQVRIGTDTSWYTVTGVMQDIPENSHFGFSALGSFMTNNRANSQQWLSNSFSTYVLLGDNFNIPDLTRKTEEMVVEHVEPQLQQFLGVSVQEFVEAGNIYRYEFQPLMDIHLNPGISSEMKPVNDKRYIYIFSLVAVLILVIAGINYTNMATARSATRSLEIGIRKVAGSTRGLIITQFMVESFVITIISLFFALLSIEIVLPHFNDLIEANLSIQYFSEWFIIPSLLVLTLILGLMSGTYPAFFLSSFKPVKVLSGGKNTGKGSSFLRNGLVILQLSISVLIIFCTLVIYRQTIYMLNKDVGYDKEQLLVLRRAYAINKNLKVFMDEINKFPGVSRVSHSTAVPNHPNNNNGYRIEGENEKSYLMQTAWVDYDHLDTYGFSMAEGRFFSKDFASDSAACIINETAVRQFGLENPLQRRIIRPGLDGELSYFNVIGIVKDFHFHSLHARIEPHVFFLTSSEQTWGYISIKITGNGINNTIRNIEDIWKQFTNNDPMVYFFMDEDFNSLYKEDRRTGILSVVFSILAILIASLGLYGLTSFTVEKRTKEIGIRKANGANSFNITLMLYKNIGVLLLIATTIAWIGGYFFATQWLQNFYYRINLTPFEFIGSLGIVTLIAWLTISYKSYMAASINPAKALKYE